MAKPDLKLIDENYVAPENATDAQKVTALRAALVKEGRRRANADLGETISKATQAALKAIGIEQQKATNALAKAAHRDGLLQGAVLGLLAAIAVSLATWTVLREVVITNVNVARTPQAAVPVLQDDEQPVTYERAAREPPDARP